MTRNYRTFLIAAAFLGTLAGCKDKDAPPPQLAPAPEVEASDQARQEPALEADQLERSELDAAAPFVLTLETPADYDKPGEIEVKAQIDAPRAIDAPTAIAVSFPAGVELLEGSKREQLADLPGGITTRTFRFKLTKGLQAENPIKVTVDMRHPGGAFGARAERVFPKAMVQTPIAPSKIPKPPVGRPGAGLKAPAGQRVVPTR